MADDLKTQTTEPWEDEVIYKEGLFNARVFWFFVGFCTNVLLVNLL